jgi:hypothetical protein
MLPVYDSVLTVSYMSTGVRYPSCVTKWVPKYRQVTGLRLDPCTTSQFFLPGDMC